MVVWQLRGMTGGREHRALRIIGISFLVLAAYIAAQSAYVLIAGVRPHHSLLGVGWLAATVFAMFALAWGKGRTGRELGSRVLETESRVTMIDGYLAAAVLVGLLLNALAGWWWADPIAGFVIVAYGLREGVHALREAA